jgi:DNA adenine methylase
MQSLHSPIKYFGGKGMMQNKILKYIPEHFGYLEGCVGGGSIFFAKRKSPIEVLNDINQNIYSLFYVLQNKEMFSRFRERCELSYYHEVLRTEAKDKLKTELSIEDRAYYYFYWNRLSVQGAGGFSKQTTESRQGVSKSVNDFLSSIERLPEIHNRLRQALVFSQNIIDLLPQYDLPKWFYYLDPPYHHSTRTGARYENDMDNLEQEKFLQSVINLKHAKVLISGYDCSEYSILEQNGFIKEQFEVNVINANNESRKSIETLWMNYQIQESLFNI